MTVTEEGRGAGEETEEREEEEEGAYTNSSVEQYDIVFWTLGPGNSKTVGSNLPRVSATILVCWL